MVAYKNIILDRDASIVTLTINRPEVLNVLNEATLLELESALDELINDQTRVIIITGAGEKAFAAGADIEQMSKMSATEAKAFCQLGQHLTNLIENHPRPIIAAINGYALGGGCELALACDIRIASDKAKLGQPEINLGIICGWGATQRLAQLVGKGRAKEMIFSGDIIDAASAEKMGLIDKVVPSSELLIEVRKLAEKLAAKPPVALSLAKRAITKGNEAPLKECLDFESECFAECFATEDQKEGMDAFANKRTPVFRGR